MVGKCWGLFPEYLRVTSLDAELVADYSVRKLRLRLLYLLATLSLPLGLTNAGYPRKPDAHPQPHSSFQVIFCSLKTTSFDLFIPELLTLENWTKRIRYHLTTMNCSFSDDHAKE